MPAQKASPRPARPPKIRTPEEVRADFDRRGICVADFCRDHDLDQTTVYQLLSGQKKGKRGESHRAAVLLGLKEGVVAAEGSALA